jgi:ureidoglycolate lyase
LTGLEQPLRLIPFDEAALEPYCTIIRPPLERGQRQFYTAWLGEPDPGMSIRLHTNKMDPIALPYSVPKLERHPRTAQIFIPLDVSRYVVLVAPTRGGGDPNVAEALAMIVPGNRGIAFVKGAWHAGASVLDRTGSFCVLHYRDDTPADDEVLTLQHPISVRA